MKFIQCPRCELNYITEAEKFCKICLREMKGDAPREEVELCSICNDSPALPGKDVCLFCLKEMEAQNGQDSQDNGETAAPVTTDSLSDMDSVSDMEILPEIGDDIQDKEFEEQMSLEDMREEEEEDEEDEEDEF